MSTSDTWTITNTRHDAPTLRRHNSVFTVSNGYLGLRGNLQEDHGGDRPVTLINGVYDEIDQFGTLRLSNQHRPYLDPEHFDSAGKSPAIANLPNPLAVRIFVGDCEIVLGRGEIGNFSQLLDLRTGVYGYTYDYRDADGRTTRIETARFAALNHAHRIFMRYSVTPTDHDAPIRILSGVDANVRSSTTGEVQFSVRDMRADPAERCTLYVRTNARQHDVYVGVQHVCRGVSPVSPARAIVEHNTVYTSYEFAGVRGQPITIDRYVVLTCSEDARHRVAARLDQEFDAAAAQGFDAALEEQRRAWAALWERADVQIDGDEQAQRYLRFCLFHLLAAAPRHSDRLSVPVKLLTGEYYQGNTFWDTDVCIVPFYTFTFPELAGTCLNFRCHGLTYGRAIARELGCEGAKFAWQAGPYGEECLGKWYRFVQTNIHINADVVYSLMQYYWATGDEAFLHERGIDILVETARFYHSRAACDAEREGLTFEDVAGPDESRCGCRSNFYTNYLAKRSLQWAADTVERLRIEDAAAFERISKRRKVEPDEPENWRRTADELILLFYLQTKLYEQCEGFFDLPPVPPELLKHRKEWFAPIYPYQAMNQPDVVMALTMFRDDFDADVRRANWEYYQDKCMNFSSMSFAVNALAAADANVAARAPARPDVAARAPARPSDLNEAYRNFIIAAGMDLDESLTGRHDTHAGLHGTAMGGAWLAAVFGFGGVSLSENGLRIDPKLPPKWNALRFNLVLRGEVVDVRIDRHEIVLTAGNESRMELPIAIAGRQMTLRSGEALRAAWRA